MSPRVRPVTVFAGGRRLQAWLHRPIGAVHGAAVVCHPHPRHGGHMDHPVVVLAAERAAEVGLIALRFDFGGVRGSEGDVERAAEHLEDVARAAAEARRQGPSGPLLGAGFSYGARMLARALAPDTPPPHPALEALLLLAPATHVPRSARDFGNLLLGRPLDDAALDADALRTLGALPVPTEVLVGDGDVVAPPEELRAALGPRARLHVLPGLNHFFSRGPGAGRTDEAALVPALDAAWRRLLAAFR